jgi:hypothetical protein
VEVLLSVGGDDASAGLEWLDGWLRSDPDLRGEVERVDKAPVPGEMGALADMLSVALSAGGTLSVLAASLKAFFAQPRGSDLTIRLRNTAGRVVEVDAKRVRDVESMLRDVLGAGD